MIKVGEDNLSHFPSSPLQVSTTMHGRQGSWQFVHMGGWYGTSKRLWLSDLYQTGTHTYCALYNTVT
jgi:hypothetical protein